MIRADSKPLVKICGLQRKQDVDMCIRHGADVLGFVVDYPMPVSWNLTIETAKELMTTVNPPAKSCVVTGGTAEHVCKIAKMLRPDYIQLHWNVSVAEATRLAATLKQLDVKLIQTIFPDTPDLAQVAADFCRTGICALLLDPRAQDNAEQGGEADISLWHKIQASVTCPVILAGGITPNNVEDTIKGSEVWMIDLMTGVESAPGLKDENLVVELFKRLAG